MTLILDFIHVFCGNGKTTAIQPMKSCLAVILSTAGLLCGCIATTPPISQVPKETIKRGCAVQRDDFRKTTTLQGTRLTFGDFGQNDFYLSAFKADESSRVSYSLNFRTYRSYYQGWAFWNSAIDRDGHALKLIDQKRDVGDGGGTYEAVLFDVPEGWLLKHTNSSIEVRIDGERAQQIIILQPNYIQAFMERAAEKWWSGVPPNKTALVQSNNQAVLTELEEKIKANKELISKMEKEQADEDKKTKSNDPP